MMILDFTEELAPLIWSMEALMLVAVVWLVAMFFAEQMRPTNFRGRPVRTFVDPEPTDPRVRTREDSDEERRIAA